MGFFKKLLGLGIAAGATVAAVKVAQKYDENLAASGEAADSERSSKEVFDGVKQAATDVYHETAVKVKEGAQKVGVDTDRVSASIKDAGKSVADSG